MSKQGQCAVQARQGASVRVVCWSLAYLNTCTAPHPQQPPVSVAAVRNSSGVQGFHKSTSNTDSSSHQKLHESHLWITALEQCTDQAGQQHSLLAGGSSTICCSIGWQQPTKPGSMLVQDVANVLQGCLAHREGMVCKSCQRDLDSFLGCEATTLFRDDSIDWTCMLESHCRCGVVCSVMQSIMDLSAETCMSCRNCVALCMSHLRLVRSQTLCVSSCICMCQHQQQHMLSACTFEYTKTAVTCLLEPLKHSAYLLDGINKHSVHNLIRLCQLSSIGNHPCKMQAGQARTCVRDHDDPHCIANMRLQEKFCNQ